MGRSQGTKETQGINGDAATLQRWEDSSLEHVLGGVYEPCGYARHRPFHSAAPDGPLMCELCHPPAAREAGRVLRGDADFDELADAARSRMTERRPRCSCGVVLGWLPELTGTLCGECVRRKAAADKLAAAGTG